MYVITTNRKRAAQAKHDYEKIYGGATIYQYTDIYMVTACFKKGVLMKEFDKRAIFVLERFFMRKLLTKHFSILTIILMTFAET